MKISTLKIIQKNKLYSNSYIKFIFFVNVMMNHLHANLVLTCVSIFQIAKPIILYSFHEDSTRIENFEMYKNDGKKFL